MSKPAKATNDEIVKDYFKLPFEVFYSGPVGVISYEFKSDIPVKRFKDVKVVHMEQGRAYGVIFSCSNNNGPELFCCLQGLHDEVAPEWLAFESEEDIRINYGCYYAVEVIDEMIRFVEQQDEIEGSDELEHCCVSSFLEYELDSTSPDYIVLDADDSRIKIDTEGYVLNEDGNRIDSKKLFEPDEIDEDKFEDFTTRELWEAKAEWVKHILEKQFPRDKKLRLAHDTA
jgi:phenylpropionate dioxygenase-like ring-hydroxylating dioxygenase large terminal subunit